MNNNKKDNNGSDVNPSWLRFYDLVHSLRSFYADKEYKPPFIAVFENNADVIEKMQDFKGADSDYLYERYHLHKNENMFFIHMQGLILLVYIT